MLSIAELILYFIGSNFDIYKYTVVGAIFELIWLPVILLMFVLPIVSFFFWRTEKFRLKSAYTFSLLICVAVWMIVLFR